MHGWLPSSSSYVQSYHPTRHDQCNTSGLRERSRQTDTKSVAVDRSPTIESKAGVKRLVDDGVAGSCEQMAELHRRRSFVNDKTAHEAGRGRWR